MQKEDFYRLEIRVEVMQMVLHSLLDELKKSASVETLEAIEDGWREGFEDHSRQLDALHGAESEHLEWLADERAHYEDLLSAAPAIPAEQSSRRRKKT